MSAHSWYEYDWQKLHLCAAAERVLKDDDRVLFLGYNNPELLFCMDRRGWLYDESPSNDKQLTEAWRVGADVAALPASYTFAEVARRIRENGEVLVANDAFSLYRLQPFPE